MRPPVDRQRIEQFLKRLDAEAHAPARVYLVGGTALVHMGLRARTLDVYLALESDAEGQILVAIRRLTHDLQINVELASPGDFIPLPAGWHDRAQWVGRYGQLDVFYFDPISLALSKIARANERDVDDVVALIRRGTIDVDELRAAYEQIRLQLGAGRYFNIDPDEYAAHFTHILSRLP